MRDPHDVLRRALITEKGSRMREGGNKYIFEVAPEANKIEIKNAVESIFDVSVERVRTQKSQGKIKRLGKYSGRRSSWKKAIITLKQGDTIEMFEEV